ncbi:MAG: hypothetical protein MUF72_20565 [Elainella sp. Prado103]|jgi:hypothetical protein|nr:hypothetical protein [Elainella sp. Prado103]
MDNKYSEKIIVLWITFLLGTLFHTQLGLMPLFHNQSILIEDNPTGEIAGILWSMFGFFTLPLVSITTILFVQTRRYRQVHFGMTVFYSVMNLVHLVADLFVQPIAWYQIALMLMLFLNGLLLNRVAFQWMREQAHRRYLPEREWG